MKRLWGLWSASLKPGIALCLLFLAAIAFADPLPYTNRTRPFTGYATTIRGDIRTVGMAGACVGLGDTFIASLSNPAGLAMTMNTGDENFASNYVHDGHIQGFSDAVNTTSFGAALSPYPWGFGLGYITQYREGQGYDLPINPTGPTLLDITTREFRASAARVFWDNRIALGLSVILGQSEREEDFGTTGGGSLAYHSYALSAAAGALIQFNHRVLFGLSYSLPIRYNANPSTNQTAGVTDFFQPILVPYRLAFGLGWIPNRFFRMDLTGNVVGATPDAALIRDETMTVGSRTTFQPRLGLAYDFADFKSFHATAFLGSYYETSRIEGEAARTHVNAGMEMKPWIVTLGWGIDSARDYRNYIVSIGIDVFKTLEKLDLIPRIPHPPYGGWMPNPFHSSEDGLARPLVKNWVQSGPPINPIQIGLDIPKRIAEKMEAAEKGIEKFVGPPKKRRKKRIRVNGKLIDAPQETPRKPVPLAIPFKNRVGPDNE